MSIKTKLPLVVLAMLAGCAEWGMLHSGDVVSRDTHARIAHARSLEAPSAWQMQKFGPMANLVGRTYRSELLAPESGSDSEATPDVMTWSWALGGAAISTVHALIDGSYGGETLIYPDQSTDSLAFVYVTTAGFRTEGLITLNDDGTWTAEEAVLGHESITKVRSTGRIRGDGALLSNASYFDNGEWVPGRASVYHEVYDQAPDFGVPGR